VLLVVVDEVVVGRPGAQNIIFDHEDMHGDQA
jgi:hypothetical protein